MQWFKHYSNVEYSESLSRIECDLGFEGLGRYWRFIEILSRMFDGGTPSFVLERHKLQKQLRIRSKSGLDSYLAYIGLVSGIELQLTDTTVSVNAPILLELQSRDFKKSRKERAKSAPRIDKNRIDKNRIDKIRVVGGVELVEMSGKPESLATYNADSLDSVLISLGKEKSLAWLDLYDSEEDWITRELKKAWQYYAIDNPKKKPKSKRGWSTALSSWLERGWSYRAKDLRGVAKSKVEENDEKTKTLLDMIKDGTL